MTARTGQSGVAGSYRHLDRLLDAIREVQKAGHRDLEVYSPVPRHEIDEVLDKPRSKVRYVIFLGALLGLVVGFALPAGSSLIWNLITGGKPIISVPPFLVIAFELTILFGGITALGAVFYFSRLPARRSAGYHPEFSDDRFGLFVRTNPDQIGEVKAILENQRAQRTWVVPDERPADRPAEDGP